MCDQPICLPELFGSKCGEALKVASEDSQKQFILKAALCGPLRSPPLPTPQGGHRFVHRREKGRTSYCPKPQGHTRLPKPSFPLGDQAGSEVGGSRLPQRQGASDRVFDNVQLPIKVIVGARLFGFAQEWDWLTSDSFVTSIVREGYQIELLSQPPLSTDPIPMPWP